MPSRRQLALLHVAKAKLGLSDDEYRAVLLGAGGVDSGAKLDAAGLDAVLGYFEHIGFQPLGSVGAHYGERPGMASPAQVQLIRDLRREYQGAFDAKALDRWLNRSFGVASLRFADAGVAGKAITALKAMKTRKRSAASRSR